MLQHDCSKDKILPLSKKEKAAKEKSLAFTWVSFMMTREPEEIKKFLKYGNPSDRLIALAEVNIPMRVDGYLKNVTFPYSLNTAAGKKKAYSICKRVSEFLQYIPTLAHNLLKDIKTDVKHRRSDTQSNIHMVAEAVLNRVATEFKPEVLFSFDSLILWVKTVYGKELGYLTVRRALEFLETAGYLKVVEWGKRGERSKATKIKVDLSPKEYILTYTSDCDMWLDCTAHGMTKVYARESGTRQDVLEAKIHHYIDQQEKEDTVVSRHAAGYRLFPTTDAKLVEQAASAAIDSEEVLWDDIYIDRLLGRMVQPL